MLPENSQDLDAVEDLAEIILKRLLEQLLLKSHGHCRQSLKNERNNGGNLRYAIPNLNNLYS